MKYLVLILLCPVMLYGQLSQKTVAADTLKGRVGRKIVVRDTTKFSFLTSGAVQSNSGTISAGTLTVANGGTGVTSLSNISGTSNQVSVSGGTGAVIGGNVTISTPSRIDEDTIAARSGSGTGRVVLRGGTLQRNADSIAFELQTGNGISLLRYESDSAGSGFIGGVGASIGVAFQDNISIEDAGWMDEWWMYSNVGPIISTTLAASCSAGDTKIRLTTPTDFTADHDVYIGSVGTDIDIRRVKSASGDTITLSKPLVYSHSSGVTVRRDKWRGSDFPGTNWKTPGGIRRWGAEISAAEASTHQQDYDLASYTGLISPALSLISPMVMYGGLVSASSPASMTVLVDSGWGAIKRNNYEGTQSGFSFFARQQNVTHATADPSNPRIDLVYWDSIGVAKIAVGTAAASPAVPSLPNNATLLSQDTIGAGVTSVTSAVMVDKRTKDITFVPVSNKMFIGSLGMDGSNNRVGIGTTSPAFDIDIQKNATVAIVPNTFGGTGNVPGLFGRQANGTISSPTATLGGATLLRLQGQGYTGSAYVGQGDINIVASENFSSTNRGTNIQFGTTTIGTSTKTERMRITDAGNVGIGDASPLYMLTVGSGDLFGVNSSGQVAKLDNTTVEGSGVEGTVDTLNWTSMSASVSAVNFSNTATGHLYEFVGTLMTTTAGTSGTVSVTISYNDGAAQTYTSSNLTFGVLGADVNLQKTFYVNSGTPTIATTVTSAVGSPVYAVRGALKRIW